jgi:hypothetical protein
MRIGNAGRWGWTIGGMALVTALVLFVLHAPSLESPPSSSVVVESYPLRLENGPTVEAEWPSDRSRASINESTGIARLTVGSLPAVGQWVTVLGANGVDDAVVQANAEGRVSFSVEPGTTELEFRAEFLNAKPSVVAHCVDAAGILDFGEVDFRGTTSGVRLDVRCPSFQSDLTIMVGLRGLVGDRPVGKLARAPLGVTQTQASVFIEFSPDQPYTCFASAGGWTEAISPQPVLGSSWRLHELDLCGVCALDIELVGVPEQARGGRQVLIMEDGGLGSTPASRWTTDSVGRVTVAGRFDAPGQKRAWLELDDGTRVTLANRTSSGLLDCATNELRPSQSVVGIALLENGSIVLDRAFSVRGTYGDHPPVTDMESGIRLLLHQRVLEARELAVRVVDLGAWTIDSNQLTEVEPGLLGIPIDLFGNASILEFLVSEGKEVHPELSVRLRAKNGDFVGQAAFLDGEEFRGWRFEGLRPSTYDAYWNWARTEKSERTLVRGLDIAPGMNRVGEILPPRIVDCTGQLTDWSTLSQQHRPIVLSAEGTSSRVDTEGSFQMRVALPLPPKAAAIFPGRVRSVSDSIEWRFDEVAGRISARVSTADLATIRMRLDLETTNEPARIEYWFVEGSESIGLVSGWGTSGVSDERGGFDFLVSGDERVVGILMERSPSERHGPLAFFVLDPRNGLEVAITDSGRRIPIELPSEPLRGTLVGEPTPGVRLHFDLGTLVPGLQEAVWCPDDSTEIVLESSAGEQRRIPLDGLDSIRW